MLGLVLGVAALVPSYIRANSFEFNATSEPLVRKLMCDSCNRIRLRRVFCLVWWLV